MKEFEGELYSFVDARKRAPGAWKLETIQGEGWTRQEWVRTVAPGLGHFERRGKAWIYVRPDGYAVHTSANYGKDVPPTLPKPEGERGYCGCRLAPGPNGYEYSGKASGRHNCSACGRPNWVEVHGMADGYCTYCYHQG